MIPDIKELNFPTDSNGKQLTTLSKGSVELHDMGDMTITADVKIDGDVTPDFTKPWAVEHGGHKYVTPAGVPAGSKDNTALNATFSLKFVHWAQDEMRRYLFFAYDPVMAGTATDDTYEATLELNLEDFTAALNRVLEFYYGERIKAVLNPGYAGSPDAAMVSISHSTVWDVVTKIYETYAAHWTLEPGEGNDSAAEGGERYEIRIGYDADPGDKVFEYGYDGGLSKIERTLTGDGIRNELVGRGGERNLPLYYFKKSPDEDKWRSDPDWVEELENIYFSRLRGATFRSYVQGWKAAHISKYPGYRAVGEDNAYAPWAYHKGYTDAKWNPVEYVRDDESIAKYGVRMGGAENKDDVYPTLQGATDEELGRLDEAVYVEQVTENEDPEEVHPPVTDERVLEYGISGTAKGLTEEERYQTITVEYKHAFNVPADRHANLTVTMRVTGANADGVALPAATSAYIAGLPVVTCRNTDTGEEHSATGIPAGRWTFSVKVKVEKLADGKESVNVTVGDPAPKLTVSGEDYGEDWRPYFYVWVKNIWGTQKRTGESNAAYAERVWSPILGDREGKEAKLVFTSGALAMSEDYEFTILSVPEYDTYYQLDGVVSHWKIKCAKSDADLETLGVYVPSVQRQWKAGDRFVFIGTEMTHEYTLWAEKRLDDLKKDDLMKTAEAQTALNVTPDRIRIGKGAADGGLMDMLGVGRKIRIYDPRFTEGPYEERYIQQMNITYREASGDDAALNPDVEIVIGEEYVSASSPIALIQGEISAIQKQVGSISNIVGIIRSYCDTRYLRKDGITERSVSPTAFVLPITSGDWRQGELGGAGWGFYTDANGNSVFETDRLNVRKDMQVNDLVVNQISARGGMIVESAAYMEATGVESVAGGWKCYFDTRQGTVENLFKVNDIAYCNRFSAPAAQVKYYKRRVLEVGTDYIKLASSAKTPLEDMLLHGIPAVQCDGTGVPAEGDVIVHFGSFTDKERQYVKVRDVVGGGYERYLRGLDSVTTAGKEYYFAGHDKSLATERKERLYIGDSDNYMRYQNGELEVKGNLIVKGTGKSVEETVQDGYGYLREAFEQDTEIEGGVVSTGVVRTGYGSAGAWQCTAGMSGLATSGTGREVAFWAGGDPGSDMLRPEPTSYMMRHDGTGWFAGGAVKVGGDSLSAGDVHLDATGLWMGVTQILATGPERHTYLDITNTDIPAPQTESGFNFSRTQTRKVKVKTDTGVMTAHTEVGPLPETFCMIGRSGDANGTTIPAGAEVQFNMSVRVDAGIPDGQTNVAWRGVTIQLQRREADGTWSDVSTWGGDLLERDGADLVLSKQITFRSMGGVYRVRYIGSGSAPAGGQERNVNTQWSGSAKYSVKNRTSIGRNAILATYNETLFYISNGNLIMKNGNYGLRVTSSGIQKMTDGENWVSANL